MEIKTLDSVKHVDRLSPNQLGTYLNCQVQWSYGARGYERKSNLKSVIGIAVDKAVNFYWEQKMSGKPEPTEEQVKKIISLVINDSEINWRVPPTELELGASQVQAFNAYDVYVANVLDKDWQVSSVQKELVGYIGQTKIKGYSDMILKNGTVVDLKTTSKSPAKDEETGRYSVPARYMHQVITYSLIEPGIDKYKFVYLVMLKKETKFVEVDGPITPAMKDYVSNLYKLVHESIKTGVYYPNRDSNLCSEEYCDYYAQCHKDYGNELA